MIERRDIISLLTDLQKTGVDVRKQLNEAMRAKDVDIGLLKFINDNKPLDVTNFYKKVRDSYNHKHSKLYINIMKQSVDNIITTLSALLNQIVLYSEKVEDKGMFLKHTRAKEITDALSRYFTNYDMTECCELLYLVKADLKAIETLYREEV